MKKWHVITGILTLVLLIGLASCVPVKSVSELEDEIARLEGELADTKAELTDTRAELAKLQDDYEKLQQEYATLQATKEMVFGEGVRVFGIDCSSGYNPYSTVKGKVQNISNEPMERVQIIVAFYLEDGTLLGLDYDEVSDLFPQEIAEWSTFRPSYSYEKQIDSAAVYAFGNRSE